MTKLKFYKKEDKKIYTLKEESPTKEKTHDAHYKYIKVRDAPKSNPDIVRKN